jgi:O-antigen/teichoic acid export membrane protein
MLKWTFQSSLFTKITLIQTLVGGTLTIGGVVLLGWRAKEVLLAGATVALGAGIWANLSIKQYIKFSTISKKRVKELVTYSWPLLGLNIFAFFTRSLDRIFLGSLTSLADVGIFSVSSAVAAIFDTMASGFFLPGVPTCFQHFVKNGLRDVTPNSSALYLGLALLALLG